MLRLMKRLTKKEQSIILISLMCIIGQIWLDLKTPEYMSDITRIIQTPHVTLSELIVPGSQMLLFSVLSLLLSVFVGFLAAKLAASFVTHLRKDIFYKVMDYSQKEIKHFSVSSLLTRTTNDLTQIQTSIALGLQVIIKGPIMAIWALTKIYGKNIEWLWVTLLSVVFMLVIITILLIFAFPKQRTIQGLIDKMNGLTRESLTGIRVVRAYNAQDYQTNKFEKANQTVTQTNLFVHYLMSLMMPAMSFVMNGLTLAIYWIGAILINQAPLPDKLTRFSDMIVFTSYAMQVVFGFMMMTMVFIIMPRTLVSVGRILDVLSLKSSVSFTEKTLPSAPTDDYIVFDNVTFQYEDDTKPVLDGISFSVKKNDTLAIIGSTGSGKSTLVNLLLRFYDVSSGAIYIDNKHIQSYTHEELNNLFGYMPQKPVLFYGTIAKNLDFGKSKQTPLTQEAMQEALRIAQADTFVFANEEGLETAVSQGGVNFSGGQKQRLAIARGIARKAAITIFDDSFSALDYQTDKKLRQTLAKERANTTKIIVAQRITTIMDADLILVLDEGKIVGQGTHETLLKTNAIYQEIAYSQLSQEELAHDK